MIENGARPASRMPLHALLAAEAVSGVGNKLSALAVPWFVLETTGSAAQTGLVGVVTVGSLIVSAFFSGLLVDRLGFKRTSIVSDILSGVTVAAIPLLHTTIGLAFWQLLLLVLIGTVLDAPGRTARQSLFPDVALSSGVRLERANAAAQTIWRLSFLLGPPLGGVLIGLIGTSNVLWLDAASFAVSSLLVGLALPADRRPRTPNGPSRDGRVLTDLVEGLRFLRADRLLWLLTISSTAGNALGGALNAVILPVFALSAFGNASALGLMLGAFGAGALAGAVLYGLIGYRYSKRSVFIVTGVVSVAPIWILATTPSLAIAVTALAIRGLTAGPYGPIVSTLYQQRIPVDQRARFFGAILAADNASTPLAILAAGLLLDATNVTTALIVVGVTALILKLSVATRPVLRQMDEASDTA